MQRGKPFFSGNYGSALGSTANAANLIAQAGQAQGQMFANLGNIAAETLDKFREKKEEKQKEDQFEALGKKLPIETFAPFGVKTEDERDELLKIFKKKGNREGATMLATLGQQGQAREGKRQFQNLMMGTAPQKVAPSDSSIRDFFAQEKMNEQAQGLGGQANPEIFRQGVAKAAQQGQLNPQGQELAMNRFMALQQAKQAQTTNRQKIETEEKKEENTSTTSLRKEFNALPEVKEFSKVRSAYNKVKEAGKDPSAAGDLSLIFNYMKILDPGSVVREGEFATAQQATGVSGKIINTYNQLLKGTRLNADQRDDFLNQARKAASGQFVGLEEQMARYRGIAERNKMNIEDILPQNLFDIQNELSTPITSPPDKDEKGNASKRALQSTPSATPSAPSQANQGTQAVQRIILQKAQNGQLLTPKEQRVLDLLQKREAQKINP